MRKKVSQEEINEWVRRYEVGETCRSISKDYPQYNENTISKHIRRLGLSRGKGHLKAKDDLKEIIITEYCQDKYATCTSLARKYCVSDRTISAWLKANNIAIKQTSGIITHCEQDYFSEIDTPNKAYLLGFITADGAVVGNCCSIEVIDTDGAILEFARSEINPIATITPCYYGKKHNQRVAFNSASLCHDLGKYGVVQNKSKIIQQVPVKLIPQRLLPFYFRGLIDGDGCVHKNGAVSIYSGSRPFLQSVQDVLVKEIGVKKLGIYQGTTYFITWSSKTDRLKLFHYLYDQLEDTFYYNRKYQRLYNSLYDNTEVTN